MKYSCIKEIKPRSNLFGFQRNKLNREVTYPFLRTDKTEVIRLLIEFMSERPYKIPAFENLTSVRYTVMIVDGKQ